MIIEKQKPWSSEYLPEQKERYELIKKYDSLKDYFDYSPSEHPSLVPIAKSVALYELLQNEQDKRYLAAAITVRLTLFLTQECFDIVEKVLIPVKGSKFHVIFYSVLHSFVCMKGAEIKQ